MSLIMEEEHPKGGRKPILCRAAICRKAGEPLQIEEVEVAPPKPWEVRIKIICTSLCYSDITFWKMEEPPAIFPRIFGHEAVGVVESVGENVKEVKEGDTVIPTLLTECQECSDCNSKKSNKCSTFPFNISPTLPRDGTTCFRDSKGEVLYHFLHVSSFSEYTVVDIANVTKIDPSIPPNKACLLGCGISTGVGAAWKTGNVEKGTNVAVFGLGAIGLAVAEGARLRGATKIIGVDLNPNKFEIGKKLGVTDFINPLDCGNKPVHEVIAEMTNGGADYCFECVGSASLVHEAYASCRKGWGKTIALGGDKPTSQLSFNSYELLCNGKTIMGSLFGDIKPKTDIPILVKSYLDKELRLDDFVTHELQFEEINKAFDLLIKGKSIRCVIWMDKHIPPPM
ncbi:alcohol dehydrogenase-like 7 [Macadamia integrifolia]|uniref:alcohol dehydrogenase-like 7 n=1 Tax=Macadamia integrifolia TaxID=60698 RepID=UPI001C4E75CD|nr:alcohol dehydrogenase-like 7 [Macadamia integrifolia]